MRLVCEGLDTVARVMLNGMVVGEADNMFRRYSFDLRPALREGENHLVVHFTSPVAFAAERAARSPYPVPYSKMVNGETHRNFVRKCGAHFGWDWGAGFLPIGIWRPIRIEAYSEGKIAYVTTRQTHREDGSVLLEVTVLLDSPGGGRGEGGVSVAGASHRRKIRLTKGENRLGMTLQVENPRLWWPNGYGEPHLYELEITVSGRVGGGQTDFPAIACLFPG